MRKKILVMLGSAGILAVLGTYSYFARSVEAFGAVNTAVPNEPYSEPAIAEIGFRLVMTGTAGGVEPATHFPAAPAL